jgi:hypothetical protein
MGRESANQASGSTHSVRKGEDADLTAFEAVYLSILEPCEQANLLPNCKKLVEPAPEIQAFNCSLRHEFTEVIEDRIRKFSAEEPIAFAANAFRRYCRSVSKHNSGVLIT